MNLSECVCECHAVCFLYAECFLSLHKLLRARVWWSGTHGDSIMHMTATKKPQRPNSVSTTAGVCRLVHRSDLLTFVHGRPLNAIVLLIIMIRKRKKIWVGLPTLAHCACAAAAAYQPTDHCRKPFMRTPRLQTRLQLGSFCSFCTTVVQLYENWRHEWVGGRLDVHSSKALWIILFAH